MTFNELPLEVQAQILSKLKPTDLHATKLVSQFFRHESLRLLSTQSTCQQTFKKLPTTSTYYAVGNQVELTQPSSPFDKSFPYRKERQNIRDKEIKNAIPKSGEVKIFRTKQEAQQYARDTSTINHSTIEHMPAVFQVHLKESVYSAIIKENIVPLVYKTYRLEPKECALEYVTMNVDNLDFISGQVSSHKEVSIASKEDKCLVM
ncbi:hypothetical protein Lnau_0633 [Legionella nautarum]|uniref:F-box domain-containing protein n=1 Tax=Legionella nautarum TaxID=45070 RepID=A0A0W0WZP0_9GAMM|nr:F-box protein [Legionella nautarum]KTD37702.1 hypothetical protein Lnau_0633 [Legionella nautarum]